MTGEGVPAAEPFDAGDLANELGGAHPGDTVDVVQVRRTGPGPLVQLGLEGVDGHCEFAYPGDHVGGART
jgi:hypothetical protein